MCAGGRVGCRSERAGAVLSSPVRAAWRCNNGVLEWGMEAGGAEMLPAGGGRKAGGCVLELARGGKRRIVGLRGQDGRGRSC